jgi:hypothetical protein
MEETVRDGDNELLPERVSLPSFCCVRVCDREPEQFEFDRDGESVLIYALCPDHVRQEIVDG